MLYVFPGRSSGGMMYCSPPAFGFAAWLTDRDRPETAAEGPAKTNVRAEESSEHRTDVPTTPASRREATLRRLF